MTDIVERLRSRKEPTIEVDMHYPQIVDSDTPDDECIEAAAEIERLRAENASLASWQCEFTDGKTGLVYGQGGTTFCIMAKKMEQNLGQVGQLSEELDLTRIEITRLNFEVERLERTNQAKREHRDKLLEATSEQAAEIERLRAALREDARDFADRIEKLEAALREMAQEDGTNARRMRAAIVAARAKLTISRPHWTGPILQADGILAQALTVDNDSAALEDRT